MAVINNTSQLEDVLKLARTSGADAAEAMMVESSSVNVGWRLGKIEALERSESAGLGVRVFVGKRQASVSTSDLSRSGLKTLVERAVAMAKASPEDPYARLARDGEYARTFPELDLYDAAEPAAEALLEKARACEEAALAVDGITNSEGAEASYGSAKRSHLTTEGFAGQSQSSSHSLSVSVIAGQGSEMQRDYDYSTARHASDLLSPEAIGISAARRTLKRMYPRKPATATVPVVFDPRVARQLLGSVASAINGASIARQTSFLKEKLGQAIFPTAIQIIDDPYMPRGLASRAFDGEGVAGQKMTLVDNGVLRHWLLDLATAAQLGMTTTGHASRGLGSPPSPSTSNLWLAAGSRTPDALIADIDQGLYVTETFGMGINLVTGDYSQGAAGFWIDKGQLAYPVNELTIAGHLLTMFKELEAADDLVFRYGTNSPTVAVGTMMVAGA